MLQIYQINRVNYQIAIRVKQKGGYKNRLLSMIRRANAPYVNNINLWFSKKPSDLPNIQC